LTALQAKGASLISARETSLASLVSRINAQTTLTASEQAALTATLTSDETSLSSLGNQLSAATTASEARSDIQSIYQTYRVYVVALPQARDAAWADVIVGNGLPRLTKSEQKLTALFAGKDASKKTATVATQLSDLASQIQTLTTATTGLASGAEAVSPSAWNANHQVLSAYGAQVTTGRAASKAAWGDAKSLWAAARA
jgi:outer membrane murein-binding lipoprotein Lpp